MIARIDDKVLIVNLHNIATASSSLISSFLLLFSCQNSPSHCSIWSAIFLFETARITLRFRCYWRSTIRIGTDCTQLHLLLLILLLLSEEHIVVDLLLCFANVAILTAWLLALVVRKVLLVEQGLMLNLMLLAIRHLVHLLLVMSLRIRRFGCISPDPSIGHLLSIAGPIITVVIIAYVGAALMLQLQTNELSLIRIVCRVCWSIRLVENHVLISIGGIGIQVFVTVRQWSWRALRRSLLNYVALPVYQWDALFWTHRIVARSQMIVKRMACCLLAVG